MISLAVNDMFDHRDVEKSAADSYAEYRRELCELAHSFLRFADNQRGRDFAKVERRWLRLRAEAGVPVDPTAGEGEELTPRRITPELERSLRLAWREHFGARRRGAKKHRNGRSL